jgi:predicted enzyme related to lactoylglutathione lyase
MDTQKNFGPINSYVFQKKTNRDKIRFNLGEIGDFELKVKNLKTAIAFYQDKLGITVLDTDSKSAVCDCNGTRFMLTKSDKPGARSVLYLKVDDIQRTYAILKERGVQFYDFPQPVVTIPGYMLWLAFFHDVDDNLLSLMSENMVLEKTGII